MKKSISQKMRCLFVGIFLLVSGLLCFGANGDVNNSGNVDINDALMLARYVAALPVSGFNSGNADTNCDGGININDALVIARYAASMGTICPGATVTATPTRTPTPTPTNVISKIMPLGDSITDGLVVPGGYRIKLWSSIQSLGKTIDFVGSMSNGPAELGDKNHEGHSGWQISQIDTNINNWMDTYKPRIVLLHIGTNDINMNTDLANAPNRLGALMDKILAKLPANGKLYVATIVPLNNQDAKVTAYNSKIPGVVQTRASAGKPVYLVDMYSKLTLADLQDGVHPNRTGYDKMADAWFAAIKNDL
jgi:lysophospholipase L1-like esterase